MPLYRNKAKGNKTKARQGKDGKTEVVIHVLTEEPTQASEDLAIAKAFWPIYVSMMSSGLIWKSHTRSGLKRRVDCHTFHCCLVLLLIWYNAAQFFFIYDKKESFREGLIIKLTGHINAIELAFCLTSFIYFNHKHVPHFLRQWENYKIKHGGLTLSSMKRHLWRRIIICNILFVLFFLSAGLASVFNPIYNSNNKYNLIPILRFVPVEMETIFGTIWALFLVYIFFGMGQTVLVVTAFCKLLSKEFEKLTQEFENTVSRNCRAICARLQRSCSQGTLDVKMKNKFRVYEVEQFRLRHFDLALMVGRLDSIVHAYLLFLYLFTIPLIVILIFGAADASSMFYEDFIAYYCGVTGLILFCVIIIWISNAGASLANKARQNKEIVQKIDVTTCSMEELMSIQIFLHKLSHDHTGLTLGKFLNIDKRLFLTLFTAIVTYLVMVLKLSIAFRAKEEKELSAQNLTTTTTLN